MVAIDFGKPVDGKDFFLPATVESATFVLLPNASFDPARNVVLVQAALGTFLGSFTVEGTDWKDAPVTETVPILVGPSTQGTTRAFKTVTKITVTCTSGSGTLTINAGGRLGFPIKVKAVNNGAAVISELTDGEPDSPGSYVNALISPPYGGYDPSALPDDDTEYTVYAELAP
jgi:hypothetical protein